MDVAREEAEADWRAEGKAALTYDQENLPRPSEAGRGLLVAMRPGETPVPIPNTMVKARAADGTALETGWESRWLPALKKEEQMRNRRGCSGSV